MPHPLVPSTLVEDPAFKREGEGFGRETCRRDFSTSSSRVAQVESLCRTVRVRGTGLKSKMVRPAGEAYVS